MPENIQPNNNNKKKMYRKPQYKMDGMPSSARKKRCFQKRREQKRLKRTIFKLHDFIKIVLIFFFLWLASRIMISRFWYLPQSTFNSYPNKHIKIIGNRITSNYKILTALKTQPIPHKPLYLINTAPYEKEIEKLSPVRKAFVRRYWLPARFEVTVEEEIPVITIAPNPKAPEIAAITADKHVISKEYLPIDARKYKTYRILTYDDYNNWTKQEIHSLEVLAQRVEDYSGEKLLYLDIRNKNDVYARIETIKIRIGELNTTLNSRIERLSSVMPQIENLKRQTDYIDLRWDNTTYLKKKSKDYVDTDIYMPQDFVKQNEEKVQLPDKKVETIKQTQIKNEQKTDNNKKTETKQSVTTKPQNQTQAKTDTQVKTQTKTVTTSVKKTTTTIAKPTITQTTKTVQKPAPTVKPTQKTSVKQTPKVITNSTANPTAAKKSIDDVPKINIQVIEP